MHAIMSNHFHILVRVPKKIAPSDAELLRRYHVLYPKPTRYRTARFAVIRQQLATNGPEACIWRKQQLALMDDVSQFMKLVKQRFSIWFNKSHRRYGTLWSERFKSVLVESQGRAIQAMAAYIDLNCVRAGLKQDPKDYRFCGYAEAVAGHAAAQLGLRSIYDRMHWTEAQTGYRQVLFGEGGSPRKQGQPIRLQKVLKSGGKLPLATVLRCRVRYFSDGAVLGSKAFVALHLAAYRRRTGKRAQTPPQSMPTLTDWGELATLRGLRRDGLG